MKDKWNVVNSSVSTKRPESSQSGTFWSAISKSGTFWWDFAGCFFTCCDYNDDLLWGHSCKKSSDNLVLAPFVWNLCLPAPSYLSRNDAWAKQGVQAQSIIAVREEIVQSAWPLAGCRLSTRDASAAHQCEGHSLVLKRNIANHCQQGFSESWARTCAMATECCWCWSIGLISVIVRGGGSPCAFGGLCMLAVWTGVLKCAPAHRETFFSSSLHNRSKTVYSYSKPSTSFANGSSSTHHLRGPRCSVLW